MAQSVSFKVVIVGRDRPSSPSRRGLAAAVPTSRFFSSSPARNTTTDRVGHWRVTGAAARVFQVAAYEKTLPEDIGRKRIDVRLRHDFERRMTVKKQMETLRVPLAEEVALWQAGECQVIDVREPAEHARQRVPRTRLIPLATLAAESEKLDKQRPVLILCRSGNRARSAKGILDGLGFRDVRVIEGGIQAWAAAGHPVEYAAKQVWAMDRQVRFAAGTLVVLGTLLGAFVHPGFLALPAFVGSALVFSAVTDTCAMARLLSKLPWNHVPPPAGRETCAA